MKPQDKLILEKKPHHFECECSFYLILTFSFPPPNPASHAFHFILAIVIMSIRFLCLPLRMMELDIFPVFE